MEPCAAAYKQNKLYYADRPPYFPPSIFEEYPFHDNRIDEENEAYASLRQVCRLLGLDLVNFGKKSWDPFSCFIKPGQTVLLKPNLVRNFSEWGDDIAGLITHGSIIRAVTDYVYIALKGSGRIIIADGPMHDADFDKIVEVTGLIEIKEFYKQKANFNLEIYDLRQEKVIRKNKKIIDRIRLKGDPCGYTNIDLRTISEFYRYDKNYECFRGSEGKLDDIELYHNEEKHEYLLSNTALEADVIINLPKMKTHGYSGVTLALKNMIGMTGNRNCLPHYSESGIKETSLGSKYITLISALIKKYPGHLFKNLIGLMRHHIHYPLRPGEGFENDIIWRTILDIAHIVSYADKRGVIKNNRQRKIFVIMDGIIAGEGEGPLNPSSKKCGVLIGGFNEFFVDIIATRLMGFNPMRVPKFSNIPRAVLNKLDIYGFSNIRCVSNNKAWDRFLSDIKGRCLALTPHFRWRNYLEIGAIR